MTHSNVVVDNTRCFWVDQDDGFFLRTDRNGTPHPMNVRVAADALRSEHGPLVPVDAAPRAAWQGEETYPVLGSPVPRPDHGWRSSVTGAAYWELPDSSTLIISETGVVIEIDSVTYKQLGTMTPIKFSQATR